MSLFMAINFQLCSRICRQEGARKRERFGIEWTHQLVVYTYDVNILDENINAINKDTESLLESSREVGLEVNTEEAKYIVVCRHKDVG